MNLLEMKNISKYFFGKAANDAVSIDVRKGEIHALLGENGAGKTTLMNILYGLYQRDKGDIFWKGEELHFSSPKEAIERRIGMVHQHFMLIPTLSVARNITLGLKLKGHPFPDQKKVNREIAGLLAEYSLHMNPETLVSYLSVGGEQWVEIIKLLYRKAELLILDEPTAVLTPQETERLFSVLRRLKEQGNSIIIITHRIPEVLDVTDRITIMREGRKVATVETSETTGNELSTLMIGRELKPLLRPPLEHTEASPGLSMIDVSVTKRNRTLLGPLSLNIGKGEILGIAGVDGNGQKILAETILGLHRPDGGTIKMGDRSVEHCTVQERKHLGLGYISDDRHHDGLIMDMGLTENVLLNFQKDGQIVKKGFIQYQKAKELTQTLIDSFKVKTPGTEVPIRLLSGGNQQKLILGRELEGNPSLIVAFQPTRGLDIGATNYVRQRLIECREAGSSILLISADLEEIFTLSDRVAVIFDGRIMANVPNDGRMESTEIGLLMGGTKRVEES